MAAEDAQQVVVLAVVVAADERHAVVAGAAHPGHPCAHRDVTERLFQVGQVQERATGLSRPDVHRVAVEVHAADRPGDRPEEAVWRPRLRRGPVAVVATEDARPVEGHEQTRDREDEGGDRADDVARVVQERGETPTRIGIGRLGRFEIIHGETRVVTARRMYYGSGPAPRSIGSRSTTTWAETAWR
jgi:hypothetical protein